MEYLYVQILIELAIVTAIVIYLIDKKGRVVEEKLTDEQIQRLRLLNDYKKMTNLNESDYRLRKISLQEYEDTKVKIMELLDNYENKYKRQTATIQCD